MTAGEPSIFSRLGEKVKRSAFTLNPNSHNPSQRWIRFAFERLSPGDDFEDWVYRLDDNSARRLNNGKAQCKTAIEKALEDYPELNYYLQIQSEKNGTLISDYYLNLKPEQIILPSRWKLE